MTSRIVIIRHGDRFDYANPAFWRNSCKIAHQNVRDPPLSSLGERQAEETAAFIQEKIVSQWEKLDAILVSPFLRTIQTAQPLARRTGVPISIEEGITETHYAKNSLPSSDDRFAYFPEIDLHHESSYSVDHAGSVEDYPQDYMTRMKSVAHHLDSCYKGKSIVCYTHAASVALVSALANEPMPLDLSFKFAPCGIYYLEKTDGSSWKLIATGEDNKHVSENNPATHPWGFNEPETILWNGILQQNNG